MALDRLTHITRSGLGSAYSYDMHNINSTGIVTATEFHGTNINCSNVVATGTITGTFSGDGSTLTGVSGFATPLDTDSASPLNKVFKTPKTLEVTAGIHTVNSDVASDNIAFMRESVIHVAAGATFHIGSGTTLRTNVLNLF